MDWQQYFYETILERGYDYFKSGAIDRLVRSGETAQATVEGSDDYLVEIVFAGDEIYSMDCSCPFAQDGNYCKHEAAVLYALDAGDFTAVTPAAKQLEIQYTAADLIHMADDATIREFLEQALASDERLFVRFQGRIHPETLSADIREYKRLVDQTLHDYMDRDNFISYREADGFIDELCGYLEEDAQELLAGQRYGEAIELIGYVFETGANADMDDSGGSSTELAKACEALWDEILVSGDAAAVRAFYDWLVKHLDGSVIDYMEEYLEDFLMDKFQQGEYLEQLLQLCDDKVTQAVRLPDSWSYQYQTDRWTARRLSLMEAARYSWDEIERYCQENWQAANVRSYVIDRCIEREDYVRAIQILQESIVLDGDRRGLTTGYSIRLKELYQLSGQTEQYLSQLWSLVLESKPGDLDLYQELKAHYPEEEWLARREEVLGSPGWRWHQDVLLREEQLYDRLLASAWESDGLFLMRKHTDALKDRYPQEVLEKYRRELEIMASHSSSRGLYRELVAILRIMRSITGGKQVVDSIVGHWRLAYSRRPAMMDELSQL